MFGKIITNEDLRTFDIKYRDLLSNAISHKLELENILNNLHISIEKQKIEIVNNLVPSLDLKILQELNSEFYS